MIGKLFLEHPRSVDESYGEHALFAGGIGIRLIGAGLAALLHAVVPALCERTASRQVAAIYARTHNRGQ
jgi:hypothetical protein